MTLVIILVALVSLTLAVYASKRRYGVLGLALCAGLILSQQLAKDTSNVLQANAIPVQPLAYSSAASVLLILLPAFILLMAGPKYTMKRSQIIGSVGFGLFATLLILGPIAADLPITDKTARPIIDTISQNKPGLVSLGIVLAVGDTFVAHRSKGSRKHRD
jgi:hypothetical protein